jgi:hypothetical protein
MKPFAELEQEYVERRLAGGIAELTGKAAGRRVRDRARLRQDLVYWTQALERHRAGREHEGVDLIRKEYAKHMKTAVRRGLPVSKAVAASEAYRTAAENRRRYEKGRHTSFANRSAAVDDSMRAKRGYKAKRQDGKKIGPEHLAEIDAIVTDFESVAGPLAELFRRTDLTIAHTNGKHPFMRPFGGLYHSSERTISVGVAVGGEPIRAGAHVLAHWLDSEAGRAVGQDGGGFLSGAAWDDECYLLHDAGRTINRTRDIYRALSRRTERTDERDRVRLSLGRYWTHPYEVFARLVEQWLASELGQECAAAAAPAAYEGMPGYWTAVDFDRLMPGVRLAVELRIGLLRPGEPGPPPVVRPQAA